MAGVISHRESNVSLAMIFPGQGSQSVGMQADLAERYSVVHDAYAEAGEALGYDLWELVQNGPAEKLNATEVTQPAMLTAGVAAYRALRSEGGAVPDLMAGHSLGEYSALVCAGTLDLGAAARLVRERGRFMQGAVAPGEGAMAAIIGLEDAAVLELCARASEAGVVEAVNFNSPGQIVISGKKAAVDRAIELATEAGARRAIPLSVSAPMHSSLLQPAGERLAKVLAETKLAPPSVEVFSCIEPRPYESVEDIRDLLTRQVFSPVQWVRTTEALIEAGANRVIESGPGKVLAGLMRRINRDVDTHSIDGLEGLQKALGGSSS